MQFRKWLKERKTLHQAKMHYYSKTDINNGIVRITGIEENKSVQKLLLTNQAKLNFKIKYYTFTCKFGQQLI